MTSPAFSAIKESWSNCHLTLLASPSGESIAEMIPAVDDVIVYEAPWMKATPSRRNSTYDHEMYDRLAKQQFDAAIIFTVFTQSPFPAMQLAYMADIPIRISYSRENPYHLLTHWFPDPDSSGNIRHEVRRQLDLVGMLSCFTQDERIRVKVFPEDFEVVQKELNHLRIGADEPFIVIHPGATAASRRYSPESFAKLAQLLVSDLGRQVIFTGNNSEVELVEKIRGLCPEPTYSVAGKLTLRQFGALLKLAPMLISNNTGPVHLAAGMNTPVIDIYALTNPQHTPWGVPNRVLFKDVPCKFCYKSVCPLGHHHCLTLVEPDEIIAAVVDLSKEISDEKTVQIEASV
jgi:lipopolysaccharide heptosyltransferase II